MVKEATRSPIQPPRCLSIDVEEYFQIESAQAAGIGRDQWDNWPSRVEASTDHLLQLFDRHNRVGTFFILGCVAARHRQLARRIAAAGHEIASHGMNHDRLHRLRPEVLREELSASRKLLEDQCQTPVIGFRAPTFSVVPQTAWAIDVLIQTGFKYDSSVFPVRHPLYGVPEAPDRPYRIAGRPGGATLLELPPLVWKVGSKNVPVAGGGYFRLLPLWFMKRGLAQAGPDGRPAILYFHPWEFDPDIPRMPLSRTGRLRTYHNLHKASGRLEKIMSQPARWTTIAQSLGEFEQQAARREVFVLGER